MLENSASGGSDKPTSHATGEQDQDASRGYHEDVLSLGDETQTFMDVELKCADQLASFSQLSGHMSNGGRGAAPAGIDGGSPHMPIEPSYAAAMHLAPPAPAGCSCLLRESIFKMGIPKTPAEGRSVPIERQRGRTW